MLPRRSRHSACTAPSLPLQRALRCSPPSSHAAVASGDDAQSGQQYAGHVVPPGLLSSKEGTVGVANAAAQNPMGCLPDGRHQAPVPSVNRRHNPIAT